MYSDKQKSGYMNLVSSLDKGRGSGRLIEMSREGVWNISIIDGGSGILLKSGLP